MELTVLSISFAILLVLSFYGMHRYEMIRGYFKHRRNLPATPPQRFAELPPVTILTLLQWYPLLPVFMVT